MPRILDIGTFNAVRESGLAKLMPSIPRIAVGMGTCGRGNGAEEVFHALNEADLIYCKIEEWDHVTGHVRYGQGYPEIAPWNAIPFFKGQKKVVLRNCGLINPSDIEEYIAVGGYQALYKVLIDGRAESVIEQVKAALGPAPAVKSKKKAMKSTKKLDANV